MNLLSDIESLLTDCDREPIHVPEAIQPHGALIAVELAGRRIAASAGDIAAVLGEPVETIEAVERLSGLPLDRIVAALPAAGPALVAAVATEAGPVDMVGHRRDGLLILEFERATSQLSAASALGAAQALASRLDAAQSITEVCQHAADAVHELTGYGRIMVYEFLADDSGAVLAEARLPELGSLLRHRFPESDIPRQARALYARNPVRVIPDSAYVPAPLAWREGDGTQAPLDMSDCHLRSVSPIHLQYLRNMNVAASASISIMVAGRLWGLIACHHHEPRRLDFVERELAKHVGQLVGVQIGARLRAAGQNEHARLDRASEEVLQIIRPGIGSVEESLLRHVADLARAIPCDGVVVAANGRMALHGSTPTEQQMRDLLPPLEPSGASQVFSTSSLSARFPQAEAFAAAASGALALVVRRDPWLSITWLRAEEIETIDWAGNPHKEPDADSGRLTPRESFELWRELVRGKARPWTTAEVAAADRLGTALEDLNDQQQIRKLNRQLNRAVNDKEQLLAQKDLLMREVHHRVQNSLQLVNSMLHLQERQTDSEEVRTHFEAARQRMTAVAMVHRRLWRTDKLGDVRLDTFMGELVDELAAVWDSRWRQQITLELAPITLSTDRAIVLGLIVTELLTNAVKHAYGGETGPVLVEAAEDRHGLICLRVADRGRGSDDGDEARLSFGSRLIEALVAQMSATLEVRDNAPGRMVELTFRAA
jgi:two-component system, chemotaxis family, sensor kinase Cph1